MRIQNVIKSAPGFLKLPYASLLFMIAPLLIAFLPAPLAYRVACLRGDWRYRFDRHAREWIMWSLRDVLGDQLSLAERKRVTRDYFRLRACEAVDIARLAGRGRALAKLVEIHGLEHIEAALAAGKGAILASAHFGSYSSCFSLIGAHGFPITVIGRWPSRFDQPIERFFFQLLTQKTVEHHLQRPDIQPRGQLDTAFQAAAILRNNELIGICLDAPVTSADRKRAVSMDFLNRQIWLLPGAITIARLTGAPVLMMFIRRAPDWRHQIVEISPPMLLDGDTVTAFRRCLAVVESAIRQNPACWSFWCGLSDLVRLGLLSEQTLKAHKFVARGWRLTWDQ
ncbi:MAG TPA: lysophospholipid acyltransferase family protein [Ktedonobacteraceae bacterium]|nr:lysophospholipid acyltransferase family protein [Ktedonobacteraceae bacterium]